MERVLKGLARSIRVVIPAFPDGGRVPRKHTCDGPDVSPEIRISNVPENVASLALVMYDPDAPIGTFYHWGMYSIPMGVGVIPEGVEKTRSTNYGVQVRNDFGFIGYGGPCPPRGHGEHRYFFVVVAVEGELKLGRRASVRDLVEELRGKAKAYGVYMGKYSR